MAIQCSFFVSIRVAAGGSNEEVLLQGPQACEGLGKGIMKGCKKLKDQQKWEAGKQPWV